MSQRLIEKFWLLPLLVFLTACSPEISRVGQSDCALSDVTTYQTNSKSTFYQSLIDQYVARGLPGITLLVKDSTGIFIGSAGMADIKNNIPMQACQVSKIASITKMMLGVCIFSLQEKGILSLNDPISKYIPENELSKIGNGKEAITIRNLLNHTTGFYDVISDNGFYLQVLNDPAKKWDYAGLMSYVYHKNAEFAFNPADSAGYSNTNFLILSKVIESATGVPHAVALRNEVFDVVGMPDTYYYWHENLPQNGIVQGYFDLYNTHNLQNMTQWNTGSGNGYGGVYSTVWDMYRFAEALFINKTLISEASLQQMLTFHPLVESRKQLGLACFKDFIDIGNPQTDYAWGHRGRDLGYSADLFYFPEYKSIMALIVNYGTDGDSFLKPTFISLRDDIARLITH